MTFFSWLRTIVQSVYCFLVKIGQIAKQAGVHVETIRFYERKGLINQPPRRTGGYREYPQETIIRIRFIKRAKKLGFSLPDIAELLSLKANPQATCADVKKRTEDKISAIHERLADLQKIKKVLEELVTACKGYGPLNMCPILESFESSEEKEEGLDCSTSMQKSF